jgi:hypothetical protein
MTRFWYTLKDLDLEVSFEGFKCEGEVVINFPPLDRWANRMSQSNLETISIVHN